MVVLNYIALQFYHWSQKVDPAESHLCKLALLDGIFALRQSPPLAKHMGRGLASHAPRSGMCSQARNQGAGGKQFLQPWCGLWVLCVLFTSVHVGLQSLAIIRIYSLA